MIHLTYNAETALQVSITLFYGVPFESLTSQQMTNTIQKKFKVSSTQLLYQSCPYQALTLFVVGPFLDGFLTNKNVFAFDYTPQVLVSSELDCGDLP
jgi:Na+/melibiose symporter-like transporter